MKRVALAVALTGLMCVTALASHIPTNDVATPGNIPVNDVVVAPPAPTSQSTTNTSSSVALANLVLTIVNLINR